MEKVFNSKVKLSVSASVRFRGGKHMYQCPVCPDQSWVSVAYTSIHVEELGHSLRIKECEIEAGQYLSRSYSAHHLLGQLRGDRSRSDPIYAQILAYLFQASQVQRPMPTLVELQSQARRYRWNMILTLLELCLWKAACILYPGKDSVT